MSILIIDDEAGLRRNMSAYLEDMDYDTLEAENGEQGLECLCQNMDQIEAVIVDLNMPVMDGYSFVRQAIGSVPEIPIVVLSGVGIVDDAIRAMRLGAWDFISKPLHDFTILEFTLERVFERARILRENRIYRENLERLVLERTAEVESTRRQIMQRLSRAAEYKDNDTGHHVIRVGEISALLGMALGFTEKRCQLLKECAPLHDIGKIGIPDNILLKPGKLNDEEWELMRQHCIFGCEILGPLSSKNEARRACSEGVRSGVSGSDESELLTLARMLALYHHERWDGKGYPNGLAGEEIPMEARIVSVVDVFDALCSDRPYKKAFSNEESIELIRRGSGSQFDPSVVDAFISHVDTISAIREKWKG